MPLQELEVSEEQLQQPNKVQQEVESNVVFAEEKRELAAIDKDTSNKRDIRIIWGVGIAFTFAFIFLLAVFDITTPNGQLKLLEGPVVNVVEDVDEIFDSVKEAVLPESASDVVSIMMGEGIAGAFGGAADFVTTSFIKSTMIIASVTSPYLESTASSTTMTDATGVPVLNQRDSTSSTSSSSSSLESVSEAVTEAAVAGGDYFMTRAAAMPLLTAMGLPPYAATIVSVLVAAVPYEMIKLAYQRKLELDEDDDDDEEKEELYMATLLQSQQQQQPSVWKEFSIADHNFVDPELMERPAISSSSSSERPAISSSSSSSSTTSEEGIDFVDVFADVIKWLAYDVMQTLFGGTINWYGHLLDPAVESAFFGLVAGLSSQVYADISYKFIGFGPWHKHDQAKNKTAIEYVTTLGISCFSGAILFGVYEIVSKGIADNSVLSPCADANDFDLCLGHYVATNIAGTSTWDAKGRAFITALVSALLRLQHVLGF